MKAKFWGILIWELFVSSGNFSFKGLSLGLFKWSEKATSSGVVMLLTGTAFVLLRGHSKGTAQSAAWGYDSSWFPHHTAVTERTAGSSKGATSVQACDRRSTMLGQQLRIAFKAYFVLFNWKYLYWLKSLIFLSTAGGVEATDMAWYQSSTGSLGLLQEAKLPPWRSARSPRFLMYDTQL